MKYVDRRHFAAKQLTFIEGRGVCVRTGELPQRKHVVKSDEYDNARIEPKVDSIVSVKTIEECRSPKEKLEHLGLIRNLLSRLGALNTANMDIINEYTSSVTAAAVVHAKTTPISDAKTTPISDEPDIQILRGKTILSCIMDDQNYCMINTGEPSYDTIVALHKYLNADGAFDSMCLTPKYQLSSEDSPVATINARKLNGLEQLILTLVLGRKLMRNIDTVAAFFHANVTLTDKTAWRYYDATVAYIHYFSKFMQPSPTFQEMKAVVPAQHRSIVAKRGIPGAVVIVADCTGIYMQDSTKRELHTVTYCDYYGGTIIKPATACTGNGYLLLPLKSTGPCDDDACLKAINMVDELKKILDDAHQLDPTAMMALLYDKGLSSYFVFEKAGIIVILPGKKQPGQILFSGKSQEANRDTAGGRIIVENLNEELKLYDMFGAVKYISRLDMVEHELNTVRFLVNLKPVVNNWTANTAHTF